VAIRRNQALLSNSASNLPEPSRVGMYSTLRYQRQAHNSDIAGDPQWFWHFRESATHCAICQKDFPPVVYETDGDYTYAVGLGEHRHMDHIIPLGAGGAHIKVNVRMVCPSCNLNRPKDGSDVAPEHMYLWDVCARVNAAPCITCQCSEEPTPEAREAKRQASLRRAWVMTLDQLAPRGSGDPAVDARREEICRIAGRTEDGDLIAKNPTP
jgi:5-methylcytosine-specific restriction endonuclease McrA